MKIFPYNRINKAPQINRNNGKQRNKRKSIIHHTCCSRINNIRNLWFYNAVSINFTEGFLLRFLFSCLCQVGFLSFNMEINFSIFRQLLNLIIVKVGVGKLWVVLKGGGYELSLISKKSTHWFFKGIKVNEKIFLLKKLLKINLCIEVHICHLFMT